MLIQEDYFRNIFNTVREAILILDGDMRVLSANRSFFTTFKVDADKTIGSLLYSLGNRQWDIASLRKLLEEILPHNDTVDDYEIEHDFESIGHKTMLLNACKIVEKETSLPIILLAIEDITERKELEDLLTESEVRYRRIFDTANDGIVLLEKRGGHIVHANPAAENMLGYTAEEYAGKMLTDIGVPIDMSDFGKIMEELTRNGVLNFDEVAVTTKSGSSIDADIYLVDRAQSAQCNIRDVSERKRKEESIQRLNRTLLAHNKSSKALMSAVDESWYLNEVCRIIVEDCGHSLVWIGFIEQDEGKTIRPVAHAGFDEGYLDIMNFTWADIESGSGAIGTSIRTGKPAIISNISETLAVAPWRAEAVKRGYAALISIPLLADGKVFGGLVIYSPSLDPFSEDEVQLLVDLADDMSFGIAAIRQRTAHKKLEEQLRHAQKMEAVGTLAGGIAHDFNNILNIIMGYGSMVMDMLAEGTPVKGQMSEVLIAAERAAALTKRLLVFSRKQLVEVKPVNINTLILDMQNMLVRIIRESIDFKLNLADRPLIVLADAGQIEQVLMNLAINARDAMLEGGRLTISTGVEEIDAEYVATNGYGAPGKYALITVTDTGHGINAEIRDKIFEPFFTTKGIGEGTGLGLAISYSIIKQHDGYIKVYSEPGHGSVFRIYLPLNEEAVSSNKIIENSIPVMGGNETVLIAEDDVSLRQLTRIVLESFGYTVIAAEDGEDAITKFMDNRERIGLVMLDMIMPKKSGKEVCEAIRNVTPEMKILFTSGYTMDTLKSEYLTASGADFISKPFLPADLLKKVREILNR